MKRLAIDFDGTIIYPGTWPHMGRLQPGVKECLAKLKNSGYHIIIHSTRNNVTLKGNDEKKLLFDMKKFLDDNDIPYNKIDTGEEGKPIADYYISTRSLKFKGDWHNTLHQIMYGRDLKKTKGKKIIDKNPNTNLLDHLGDIND